MKSFLLLPLSVILSCSTVKKPDTQSTSQLLKDVEVLSSDRYEGRKTGTKGAEMARTYITDRFKELGVKSYAQNYAHPFTFQNQGQATQNGINVLGYIPGKTDNAIVISAHYDHIGVINGEIYNGADDNASGVAALLEFAAYYTKNQPIHTLIFAAFDAEEVGLQGAKAFVAKPPVSLDKIVLNVNMDMISHNDKAELYVCGTFKYPELKKYIITSSPDIKVIPGHDDPKLGHDDWTNQSDHGAFNAKNIPFLYFGVEDHKDYHKESDEFRNINQSFFTNAVNAIREIISNIEQDRDAQKRFKEKLKMK
ncbi:M28 family peptidase [Pedobacter deserti]|uniref:M28 family peptidase n=1 Tax=Pedobacter deserti TaxID=2817382 RepID=UPI002108787B|nr:M28 family peptidase [Pedobacter sp. SYSU D00382]